MTPRLLATIVAAGCLTGCTVGPNYNRPAVTPRRPARQRSHRKAVITTLVRDVAIAC